MVSQQSAFRQCCKSVITIFASCCFGCVITPLTGCDKLRFCIYYSTTTNTNITRKLCYSKDDRAMRAI